MDGQLLPPTPGSISVGSLSQANRHKRRYDAVITLEDPRARQADRLRFTVKPAPAHLVLAFEDVDHAEHDIQVATREQVAEALAFAGKFTDKSILVHCFHGVGRSAAIALAIIAQRLGAGNEEQAIQVLLDQRPQATPNMVVLAHADAILSTTLVSSLKTNEQQRGIEQQRAARRSFVEQNLTIYAKNA